jgi:hypothetical protein
MSEKRKVSRRRTLLSGTVVFNQHGSVITCVIKNLSDIGACIEVPSPTGIPDTFELSIEPGGRKEACQVAWRSEKRVGVRFA